MSIFAGINAIFILGTKTIIIVYNPYQPKIVYKFGNKIFTNT